MSEKQILRQRVTELQVENNQLKELLQKFNERGFWCYACGAVLGNVVGGVKHAADCEYVRLTGGAE